MSEDSAESDRPDPRQFDSRVATVAFGDRLGLLAFLGTIAVVWIYWRAGVFITDTDTLVRTLDSVAQGHLFIDDGTGTPFSGPGAVIHDGTVYGRDYGLVVLALPVLWLLEAVSTVADLRVALIAGWHLVLLAVLGQVAHFVGRRRPLVAGGVGVVLGSFLLNLVGATSFGAAPHRLLALQTVSILATGALAVFTYRLCQLHYGARLSLLAAGTAALVLPIGFWGPIPKRHVPVATILLGILYLFARSRRTEAAPNVPGVGSVPVHRAGAYALVGLLAWIHAGEALFVFLGLLVVDLPTAPRNGPRQLGFVAGVFLVSMIPFFLTNLLISGEALSPPRSLPGVNPDDLRTTDFLREAGSSGGTETRSADGGGSFSGILGEFVTIWSVLVLQVERSLARLSDLEAVVRTWFRSGSLDAFTRSGVPEFRAANLAVLESVPLFGAFAVTVSLAARRRLRDLASQVRATDILALSLTTAFVLLYMQKLPLHVQVTVRYLLPIYPLLLYLVVRLAPVRRLLEPGSAAVWTYGATVLIGSQLVLAFVVGTNQTVSEAVQLHGVLGLGAATLLAVSVLGAAVDDRLAPLAGVSLGLAAGAGTVFILLSGLAYFSFVGQYALPAAQAVADLVGGL